MTLVLQTYFFNDTCTPNLLL